MNEPQFSGAVAPERAHNLESNGVRLRLHEWGDPAKAAVVLCHGLFDHARGFDLLAPRLAERFRVVAIDARGHGDSSWTDAYIWPADVADITVVLRSLGRPAHLVGHSKGGGQAMDAATWAPELVRKLVNIDGFGPPPEGFQSPQGEPRASTPPARLAEFLDRRRSAAERSTWRSYATLDELVERRRRQNPRLTTQWLRYFAFHGARRTEDGWRWKSDPYVGFGAGPWQPEWIAPGWKRLRAPLLAITGSEPDSWGPLPEDVLAARLAHVKDVERATVSGAGHFVHMERPNETAELLLGFLEQ